MKSSPRNSAPISTNSGYTVEAYSFEALSRKLRSETAEYSILTRDLDRENVEEININGRDRLSYSSQHAVDILF